MKKVILTIGVTLAVIAGACAPKTEAKAEPQPVGTEAAPEAPAAASDRSGTVIALRNDNTFRPGHAVKRLTVLDFNATWCGPCRQLTPVFKDAAKKYKNIDFISVDVDQMPATAQAFGVQAVPTVVFLSPDGTQRTFVGTQDLLPAETFFKLLDNALKK